MKKLALVFASAVLLPFVVVVGTAQGQTPPPPPPLPPTIAPPPPPGGNPTPTLPATPTAVPTATFTAVPTATNTPVPLTVNVSIAHKTVAPNKKQKISVTTLPGADVTITVTFPNKKKKKHEENADGSGSVVWQFKQPANFTTSHSKTAQVSAKASLGGQTVSAAKHSYKIGPGK